MREIDPKTAAAIAKAESEIGLRSSAKEVEAVLKANGLMPVWDYPKDDHFRRWVLRHLTTAEEVHAFLAALDADNRDGRCTKARVARGYLTGEKAEFWNESIDRMRAAIAPARRVCCWCHKNDSFELYEQ